MLTNACRDVAEYFSDIAGIESFTSKLIYDTRTEMKRNGIFHTEPLTDLERRESELKRERKATQHIYVSTRYHR